MGAWAITFLRRGRSKHSLNLVICSHQPRNNTTTSHLRQNVHHYRQSPFNIPSNLRPNKHHHKTQTLPPPLHHSRQHSRRRRNRHNLPSRIRQNPHAAQLPPLRRPKTPLSPLRSPMVCRMHNFNHRQQHQSRRPLRRVRSI